jgi:hypothetical protein
MERIPVRWILDADIRGSLDNVDHEWVIKNTGTAQARRPRQIAFPPGRNQLRTYLLNQSIVRCQARSAAALLYRSGVASQLKPCTAPG